MSYDVRMSQYLVADDDVKDSLIPPSPAVYVWRLDFGNLKDRSGPARLELLTEYVRAKGRLVRVKGDPFLTPTWTASRPPLPADRARWLTDHLDLDLDIDLCELFNEVQRPLYVGISKDLQRRTNEHMSGETALRSGLTPLSISDCLLTWWPAESLAAIPIGDDETDDGTLSFGLRSVESLLVRVAAGLHNNQIDS